MVALPHVLLGLALFGPSLLSGAVQAAEPLSIEIFTTTDLLISGKNDSRLQGATVTVHFVDGLERFEAVLSQDLPADADVARTEAFRRIGELNEVEIAPAKNAAIGLAKAVQRGIDRYPAIAFDGTAVSYGVTDLLEALDRYEAWRREQAR